MSASSIPQLHYIPLSAAENDTEIVRRCLRKYGRQLQQQGEIPPYVSETEINTEMETHVPRIVRALHRSSLYPYLKMHGRRHLEEYIQQLLTTIEGPAPVAANQSSYINLLSSESLSPTWIHRKCGGTVYPADETFRCSSCKRSGELGVEFPVEMSRQQQMSYLLTHVKEVDLI